MVFTDPARLPWYIWASAEADHAIITLAMIAVKECTLNFNISAFLIRAKVSGSNRITSHLPIPTEPIWMRIIQLNYLSSAFFYFRPRPIQSIIMNVAFLTSGILALACMASCTNPSDQSVPPNKENDVICSDLAILGLQPGVKIIREDTYEAQFIDGQWQHVREQFLGRTDFEFSEKGELLGHQIQ